MRISELGQNVEYAKSSGLERHLYQSAKVVGAGPSSISYSPVQLATKRSLDVFIAASILLALAPVLLLIALLIRLDSPGPALFTQVRWGQNCRRIRIYKFRSMRADAEMRAV